MYFLNFNHSIEQVYLNTHFTYLKKPQIGFVVAADTSKEMLELQKEHVEFHELGNIIFTIEFIDIT